MNEHEITPTEITELPPKGYYANLSDENISVIRHLEGSTLPTESGQKAAEDALIEIHNRSFAGRHPGLGKMVNCQFCGLRHRENERKCEQVFTTVVNRGPNEQIVPERRALETRKGILGAARFAKKRLHPHSNRWAQARANEKAAKKRKKEPNGPDTLS